MQLVVSLVEQLDGAIDLIREGGTEFRITFKCESVQPELELYFYSILLDLNTAAIESY